MERELETLIEGTDRGVWLRNRGGKRGVEVGSCLILDSGEENRAKFGLPGTSVLLQLIDFAFGCVFL